jgi:hypothetical protein
MDYICVLTGQFKTHVNDLNLAPTDMLSRNISDQWVLDIKNSIRMAPGKLITRIPVNLKLNEVIFLQVIIHVNAAIFMYLQILRGYFFV